MATWTLTTLDKKSVEEHTIWRKGDLQIVRIDGYRWGTYTCDSEQAPEIDLENPDGLLVNELEDFEMSSLDDGWYGDWEFPEDMSEEEQERLLNLWETDWYEGLESDGWSNDECLVWFYGPLSLEKSE